MGATASGDGCATVLAVAGTSQVCTSTGMPPLEVASTKRPLDIG